MCGEEGREGDKERERGGGGGECKRNKRVTEVRPSGGNEQRK